MPILKLGFEDWCNPNFVDLCNINIYFFDFGQTPFFVIDVTFPIDNKFQLYPLYIKIDKYTPKFCEDYILYPIIEYVVISFYHLKAQIIMWDLAFFFFSLF